MTFDLGLAYNLSSLSLATGSNYIYPGHVTVIITKTYLLATKSILQAK